LAKAKNLIPSITKTLSRIPFTFVEDVFPIYAKSASDSHFIDVDDNEYFDFLRGLGP